MTPTLSNISSSFSCPVKRQEPELVLPAKPTPREVKQLSDIDDQEGLRFHVPFIFFYKNNDPSIELGQDPIRVIKESLSRVLVYYYPLAGRLKQGFNRKLSVDCTVSGGVLFVGAKANVTFQQLEEAILKPYLLLDEFLCNVPGSDGILDCPLLFIQVTKLLCGGFVLALRLNHVMCDAFGLVQFLNALADMARGKNAPFILPVWKRELLNAREPPQITFHHQEYEETFYEHSTNSDHDTNNMIQRSFFFDSDFINNIRKQLPRHLMNCSKFEILTACLWKTRTLAMDFDPNEIVRVCCLVGAREYLIEDLPPGFYGNVAAYPAAVSESELLCKKPLSHALELVQAAKAKMSDEYMHSVADFMATRGRPKYITKGNFVVSDTRLVGLEKVDFGWGVPAFAGPAMAFPEIILYGKYKNSKGQEGIVVPVCLPSLAMNRFELELKKMTADFETDSDSTKLSANNNGVNKIISKI